MTDRQKTATRKSAKFVLEHQKDLAKYMRAFKLLHNCSQYMSYWLIDAKNSFPALNHIKPRNRLNESWSSPLQISTSAKRDNPDLWLPTMQLRWHTRSVIITIPTWSSWLFSPNLSYCCAIVTTPLQTWNWIQSWLKIRTSSERFQVLEATIRDGHIWFSRISLSSEDQLLPTPRIWLPLAQLPKSRSSHGSTPNPYSFRRLYSIHYKTWQNRSCWRRVMTYICSAE